MIKGGKVPMSKKIISGENTDIFIIKRTSFHFVLVMQSQNCRLIETGGTSETWSKLQLYVCRRKPGLKINLLKPLLKKTLYLPHAQTQPKRLSFLLQTNLWITELMRIK